MISVDFSYVTLVSTDSYLIGALALNESLKNVSSKYPLTIVLSVDVNESANKILESRKINYIRLTTHIDVKVSNINSEYSHWSNTFDKLYVFGLTKFQKIVFLDSDMMVVNNIDHLFDKPNLSAVVSDKLNDEICCELNSGLFIFEPQEKIVLQMQSLIQTVSQEFKYFGDQDIIRLFFDDWKEHKELELDIGYNMYYPDIKTYKKQGYDKNGSKKIYVVHFVGAKKPWMFSLRKIYRTLKLYDKCFLWKYLVILFIEKGKLFSFNFLKKI